MTKSANNLCTIESQMTGIHIQDIGKEYIKHIGKEYIQHIGKEYIYNTLERNTCRE